MTLAKDAKSAKGGKKGDGCIPFLTQSFSLEFLKLDGLWDLSSKLTKKLDKSFRFSRIAFNYEIN